MIECPDRIGSNDRRRRMYPPSCTRWCSRIVCLLLLAFPPGFASAAIPAGSFEIQLGGSQSIWLDDAEGENAFCEGFEEGFGGTLQTCAFEMFVDAKGKITGSVSVAATNGNLGVQLEGPI